ncbi:MAG: energy transducer TonB [Bacteroidia bacterium]|nr:energy transducer TonB [Bacteroidia bacterium]
MSMRWRGLLVMLLVGVGFAQTRSSPSQVSPKQPQAPTRYDKYAPSSQPANDEHSTTSDERTNPSPTGNEFTHTEEPEPDPTAFVLIEKEPVATNLEEIKRRIGYPPLAKEAGIQGKVIVRVLV